MGESFYFNDIPLYDASVKTVFADAFYGNDAVLNRIERVVLAKAHVLASHELRASLTDDDIAFLHLFTRIELDAQVFWLGIGKVFGTSGRLFCCHFELGYRW